MNSTKKYITEHEHIFSLKNKGKKDYSGSPNKLNKWSFLGLCYYHLKSVIRCIIYLPIVLYGGRKFFNKTLALKGSAKKKTSFNNW